MSKPPILKKLPIPEVGLEPLLLKPVFKIGKRCREWFLSLQEPEPSGLRQAGVNLLGQSILRPPYIMARPFSDFHILLLPIQGEMRLTRRNGISRIRAGDIWLIPADSLSRYELPRGVVKMTWVHLNRKSVPHTLQTGEPTLLSQGSPAVARMFFYMDSLRTEGLRNEPLSREMRCRFYELIAIELRRILHTETWTGNGETASRIEKLWGEIEQSPGQDWDVPSMARKADLSPSRFHAFCQNHFGETPHEKITRIRMNRAISLLLSSSLKVEAIAKECGYSTPFSFSKVFKKSIGLCPKGFRENPQAI